jgi:hypothetical protein
MRVARLAGSRLPSTDGTTMKINEAAISRSVLSIQALNRV